MDGTDRRWLRQFKWSFEYLFMGNSQLLWGSWLQAGIICGKIAKTGSLYNHVFSPQICPTGYYCDNRQSPVVLFKNSTCPVGHYCPEGTKVAYENKCPQGTFSNETGLTNITECTPCPGGFYCPELGQETFTLKCSAGKV